jgi:hypothetical protein
MSLSGKQQFFSKSMSRLLFDIEIDLVFIQLELWQGELFVDA